MDKDVVIRIKKDIRALLKGKRKYRRETYSDTIENLLKKEAKRF
jgi:hypothetical protein